MTDYEKNKTIVKQSTEAIKTYLSSITVGIYIINGFPNNWTKVQQPYIAFKPIVYNTITTTPAKWPSSLGYITERDIVYEYPQEGNFETATNEMIITPPVHGISGGGVWKTNINIQGKVWSTDQIKLIGIQIGKPKDCEMLHGIQIQNWLEFLGKSDTNIANSIAKHFPDKQVSNH